jgi:hypothetical protein
VLPLADPSLLSYTAGGDLLGDHAVAYDPSGDRTLCAGTTLDPEGTTVGTGMVILPVNRGRPAAIRWRSECCATIGLEYHPWAPPARRPSPLIGHGPLAGQSFFELRLEHGPRFQTVSLVISPELVDDAEDPCTPVILRPPHGFSLLSTVTDGAGAAAMRVPLDEIALPELFPIVHLGRSGEILVFPRLYAQWQWTVLTGDFRPFPNGLSDFVRNRSARTITQTSDVMVLVVDV